MREMNYELHEDYGVLPAWRIFYKELKVLRAKEFEYLIATLCTLCNKEHGPDLLERVNRAVDRTSFQYDVRNAKLSRSWRHLVNASRSFLCKITAEPSGEETC